MLTGAEPAPAGRALTILSVAPRGAVQWLPGMGLIRPEKGSVPGKCSRQGAGEFPPGWRALGLTRGRMPGYGGVRGKVFTEGRGMSRTSRWTLWAAVTLALA